MGKFLNRPPAGNSGAGQLPSFDDPDFEQRYPAICEYVSTAQWEDGTPRETSTLLLFVEDGLWKCCLNDRAVGRSGWRAADTLQGVLDALEAVLREDCVEWRVAKGKPQGRPRK